MSKQTIKTMVCRDIKVVIDQHIDLSVDYDKEVAACYPDNKDIWLLNDVLKKLQAAVRTVHDDNAYDIIKHMAMNVLNIVGIEGGVI